MKYPTVKIAACVSNEAYYLPQWIHHHSHFGVNRFDMYVNRTTDNTLKVLDKLKSYYNNIVIYNVDWIDIYYKNNPPYSGIQNISYISDYYNTDKDIDYILYIDIDEFWMPFNCEDTIQKHIIKLKWPDCIVYEWFCIGGAYEYIQPLMSKKYFHGKVSWYTKTLIKTGLHPSGINVHLPSFNIGGKILLANGDGHQFNRDEGQTTINKTQRVYKIKDYFILHDCIRDLTNNFAKFARGWAPLRKCNSIDSMAQARSSFYPMEKAVDTILFHNRIPSNYYCKYWTMIKELDLFSEFREAKIHEILYALSFLRQLHANHESKFAKSFMSKFKSITLLHDRIFDQLIELEPLYKKYRSASLTSCEALISANPETTISKCIEAINLYPYDIDIEYRPLFMKTLIQYLTDIGDFKNADYFINNKDFISNRVYGNEWAMAIFAKAYEKNKYTNTASQLYKQMEYSRDKNIYNSIDRIKAMTCINK